MPLMPIAQAHTRIASLLREAGALASQANTVAAHLVDADACGYPSHGCNLVPSYVEMLSRGHLRKDAHPTVQRLRPGALAIDGGGGFGQVAADLGVEALLKETRELAVAVAAFHSTGHVGRLGDYVEALANAGRIGLMVSGFALDPREAIVAPVPGAPRVFGTNPIAIGTPGPDGPVVVDFATAGTTVFQALLARRREAALPAGVAVDADGLATASPEAVFNGGALLPMGGIKGAALALASCLLGALGTLSDAASRDPSAVAGARATDSEAPGIGGTLLLAVDVAAFAPLGHFSSVVARLANALNDGCAPFRVPGARARAARARAQGEGVRIDDTLWTALDRLETQLRPA